MNHLTCLIVEDEPLARQLLTDHLQQVPYLRLTAACATPTAAMAALQRQPVDLLFLDVQMPEMTGLTLLRLLPRKPLVILTTAYSEYALESYDLDVVDYLLKPITLDRFLRAVHKAYARWEPPVLAAANPAPAKTADPAYLFVKDGSQLLKVWWADVLYVEGLRDYVTIHTRQRKIVSLQQLKVLTQQLPADRFVRIHHSCIVALDAIDVVHKDKVQIGERYLPISATYAKGFREAVERHRI
ncbi:LytR/AlgR family response regulator transcription factor [Hymenobacter volaticus]|uniref:LytTR family DNA-binding domain-containing protein n=1 Tax=Hymenobacter volaticus TaxID=2932254 RepID=A0ABY4GED3_9BACT|nr:LytTR family DNA-binding domain-containing protein [Hymenobacter volaticus]UOQ69213.1 LytTR family DNA-binding domain-containing protein [Hymenobacter volaticus]